MADDEVDDGGGMDQSGVFNQNKKHGDFAKRRLTIFPIRQEEL